MFIHYACLLEHSGYDGIFLVTFLYSGQFGCKEVGGGGGDILAVMASVKTD